MKPQLIQPIKSGRCLVLNEDGFVRTDVGYNHIQDHWKEATECAIQFIKETINPTSIYIRGSVPRGLAIDGISDLDLICLSEISDSSVLRKQLDAKITARFPFIKGVECVSLNQEEFAKVYEGQTRPYYHMLLKTQSLLIYGIDVTSSIAPFNISKEMVTHVFQLEREFSKLSHWLEQDRQSGHEVETRKWFSRRLLRSGFEIVMTRAQVFTRDLWPCYEIFLKYYPDKSSNMYEVLCNALNGHIDPLTFKDLVSFIINEKQRVFQL